MQYITLPLFERQTGFMVMVAGDASDMSPSSEVSVKENELKFAARVLATGIVGRK